MGRDASLAGLIAGAGLVVGEGWSPHQVELLWTNVGWSQSTVATEVAHTE